MMLASPSFGLVQSTAATGNSTTAAATFASPPTGLMVAAIYENVQGGPGLPAGWSSGGTTNNAQGGFRFAYKIAGSGESSTVSSTVLSGAWAIAIAEYNVGGQIALVGTSVATGVGNNGSQTSQTVPAWNFTLTMGKQVLFVVGVGMQALSVGLSTFTLNGAAMNKRQDTNQGTNAANIALCDLVVPANVLTTFTPVMTASGATAGDNGILAFYVPLPSSIKEPRQRPHIWSPGNPR